MTPSHMDRVFRECLGEDDDDCQYVTAQLIDNVDVDYITTELIN